MQRHKTNLALLHFRPEPLWRREIAGSSQDAGRLGYRFALRSILGTHLLLQRTCPPLVSNKGFRPLTGSYGNAT